MQQDGQEFYEAVGGLPRSLRAPVAIFLMEEHKEIMRLHQFIQAGSRMNRHGGAPSGLRELHGKFYQMLQALTIEYTVAIKTAIADLPD